VAAKTDKDDKRSDCHETTFIARQAGLSIVVQTIYDDSVVSSGCCRQRKRLRICLKQEVFSNKLSQAVIE